MAMGERRFIVQTCCKAVVVWVAAAGAALADPPAREFWPAIDVWLRVSNAWRPSGFVPVAENLDTRYREGSPVLQAGDAWSASIRNRRHVFFDMSRRA